MLKTFAVGALLASICAAAVAPGVTEPGEAAAMPSAANIKDDGLTVRAGEPACSQTGWPHYTDDCIQRRVQPSHVRQVRVVTVDRLPE